MSADTEIHRINNSIKVDHNAVAASICKEKHLIYSAEDFYEYRGGVYVNVPREVVTCYVKTALGGKFSVRTLSEIMNSIKATCYVNHDLLNKDPRINLKNGLFDIGTWELTPHDPAVRSTIQLSISFDPDAKCPTWNKTLDEIFGNNADKVEVLQEFFGLCLTKDTKYNKALFMLGEGRNGKSTVLYVLEHLVGDVNRSSIPLEKLNDLHYVAALFNKLVNISIETNAKSEVYDATFKAITSGDSLTADPKYKHPFLFRPHCKLIYALNNMPRVNDKTDAYFRRLLILRFDKQFEGTADNKNLKYELLNELNGIFLWCLCGLRSLERRGDFKELDFMKDEIKKHRIDNNSAVEFIEEEGVIGKDYSIPKGDLYTAYKDWCKESIHQAFSKKKFGMEMVRYYKVSEIHAGRMKVRMWSGIGLKNTSVLDI